MELRAQRPRFLFFIDEQGTASCNVGSHYVGNLDNQAGIDNFSGVSMKAWSSISVLSVYDTYGIEMVYSYLKYLYYNKYSINAREWLTVYLQGSLRELREGHFTYDNGPYQILFLCAEITRILEEKDRNEPRLLTELSDVPEGTLPTSLLSRILGSTRISKDIKKDVLSDRCSVIPTPDEVLPYTLEEDLYQIMELSDGTLLALDIHAQYGLIETTLIRKGKSFVYHTVWGAEDREYDGTERTVGFMLGDYGDVFRARGCNPDESVIQMLKNIRRETHATEENARFIAVWVMVLSYSLDENSADGTTRELTLVWKDVYELAEELDRLIEVGIATYGRDEDD